MGLCAEAVEAFTRAGQPKRAVDCCVLLNQWDQAVALAQQHDFPQVEGLMARCVGQRGWSRAEHASPCLLMQAACCNAAHRQAP